MQKFCTWTMALCICGLLGSDPVWAQDTDDAPSCWWEYASCARQSSGDPIWRSVCYADFSGCLGKQELPTCPETRTAADCLAYKAECDALAAGDLEQMADCSADADVCAMAHGC